MTKEKPKKSKKTKIIIGIIIVVIILIIAGSHGTPKKVTNGNNTSSSQQTNFKIGQTIKMGDCNVTINSLHNQNTIGFDGVTTDSTKNNFAVVKLTLENTSNNPMDTLWVGNNNIFTLSSDNNNYSVNFGDTVDVNTANHTSNAFDVLNGTQLSPHTKYTCYISFTTPKPIKNGQITVNLNGEKANIQL